MGWTKFLARFEPHLQQHQILMASITPDLVAQGVILYKPYWILLEKYDRDALHTLLDDVLGEDTIKAMLDDDEVKVWQYVLFFIRCCREVLGEPPASQ